MYTIGIDFGTLSARAVLADASTGKTAASSEYAYPSGVIEGRLPCGRELPDSYALQDPRDYTEALIHTVSEVVRVSGVDPRLIKGIGLDVTSATVLPIDINGTPLCMKDGFRDDPHAWPKLWKHHGAQKYADELTEKYPELLRFYGGRANAEWAIPKIMETMHEAPDVFAAAYRFIEAGDWLTLQMTGRETRGLCAAGFKYFYDPERGYPDIPVFGAIREKLGPEPCAQDSPAGVTTGRFAEMTGLTAGITVTAAHVDAHAGIPSARALKSGHLLMNIGTSSCHMLLDSRKLPVRGISGCVDGGAFPGLVCYEAGQTAVGESFRWAADMLSGGDHALLTEKAAALRPGESGLMALDWLGGNRSILADSDLTGLIAGITPHTAPHEIYRALLESTAFGALKIVDAFRGAGLRIDEIIAAGGISRKNPLLMQIYADVFGMPVNVAAAEYGAALGSAIFAAAACGLYPSVSEAAGAMTEPHTKTYIPDAGSAAVYKQLYSIYGTLHDAFAENGVMAALRRVKNT